MRVGGRGRLLLLALLSAALVVPARAGAPGTLPPGTPFTGADPADVAAPRLGVAGTTTEVDAAGRTFLLHVPDRLLGPAPLLLVLHAYTEDVERVRAVTGLEALADREGFVVAFPAGLGGSWDAGACCGFARREHLDDVAHLDAVVRAAAARALVDPHRVAVTGFSNGAMMALRYACERAGLVSAAAVVAGVVAVPCAPSGPVAVLDLHGTADRTVPLAGGRNPVLDAVLPPVRRSLEPFAQAGGEVAVVPLPGVGHAWPAGGARAVWEWVRDHPRT